jgi:hypothetical protein
VYCGQVKWYVVDGKQNECGVPGVRVPMEEKMTGG